MQIPDAENLLIGGGVVGLSAAWALSRRGRPFVLADRGPGPAEGGASKANAGQLSYGYSTPWPAPGIPLKALGWLFDPNAPLRLRPDGTWDQLAWLARFLGQCTARRYEANKKALVALSEFSKLRMESSMAELGAEFSWAACGTLQLLSGKKALEAAKRDAKVLREAGVAHRLLDRQEAFAFEPALRGVGRDISGGMLIEADEKGDCFEWCKAMGQSLSGKGALVWGAKLLEARRDRGGWIAFFERDGEVAQARFKNLIDCAGSAAEEILALAGEKRRLGIYPMGGFSATCPIGDGALALRGTVLDEERKIAVTRLGDKIRVGGLAWLDGKNTVPEKAGIDALKSCADSLFPGACDWSGAEYWRGLRPARFDSVPLIGQAADGLWLCAGHGTLGWTQAAGSAELLAALMCKEAAPVNPEPFDPAKKAI